MFFCDFQRGHNTENGFISLLFEENLSNSGKSEIIHSLFNTAMSSISCSLVTYQYDCVYSVSIYLNSRQFCRYSVTDLLGFWTGLKKVQMLHMRVCDLDLSSGFEIVLEGFSNNFEPGNQRPFHSFASMIDCKNILKGGIVGPPMWPWYLPSFIDKDLF